MSNSEIKWVALTYNIREFLKNQRGLKNIGAVELSEKIGKSKAFFSIIETGKTQKIKYDDLLQTICILLDVDNDVADKKIQELVAAGEKYPEPTLNMPSVAKIGQFDAIVEDQIDYLKEINDHFDNIKAMIFNAYSKKPEYIIQTLNKFNKNLHWNLEFLMAFIKVPLYSLEIDTETQEKLLKEIMEVVDKYRNSEDID